jgi:hypothetical protein
VADISLFLAIVDAKSNKMIVSLSSPQTTTGSDGSFTIDNIPPNRPLQFYRLISTPKVVKEDGTDIYLYMPESVKVDLGKLKVIVETTKTVGEK